MLPRTHMIFRVLLLALPFVSASCGDSTGGVAEQGTEYAGNAAVEDITLTGEGSAVVENIALCTEDAICDDGLYCNGAERCNDERCISDTAPVCEDFVECTINSCDNDVARCVFTPDDTRCPVNHHCDAKAGCTPTRECRTDSDCDDALFCNGVETCDMATNRCSPGVVPDCDDAVLCTRDICDTLSQACQHIPEHTLCDPDELCNIATDCTLRPTCESDATCDDGSFCNGAETCDFDSGACVPGTPPHLDDGVDCTRDACSEEHAQVTHIPLHNNCDDALFCNGSEQCSVTDGCVPGTPLVVDDAVDCTRDSCDEENDQIVHLPNHEACDDALFCNGIEQCDVDNGCVAGAALEIEDEIDCTRGSCDENNNQIIQIPEHSACDDALFCNGIELCDLGDGCVAGTAPERDDGVACTHDSCDEESDQIVHMPNHMACDDALFCNGTELCSVSDGCIAGEPLVLDDAVDCTRDSCDEESDQIVHLPNHMACDDALFCNGIELCDVGAGCVPGTAPRIDDGVGCTRDSCDEESDQIVHAPNHAACDDALFCNGSELCDVSEGCVIGTAPIVDDGVGCTRDRCDEEGDRIVHAPDHDVCNDDDACTDNICDASDGCQTSTATACMDDDGCCATGCNASNDNDCVPECGNAVVEPGESCEESSDCIDGGRCTGDCVCIESCADGADNDGDQAVDCDDRDCQGDPACPLVIPFQGLYAHEGTASWNTTGAGSEPQLQGHMVPSPFSRCGRPRAYRFMASPDYAGPAPEDPPIDPQSPGAAHALASFQAMWNLEEVFAQYGYLERDLRFSFGRMDLGEDIEGEDWFIEDGIETRIYQGGTLTFTLDGYPILEGLMPSIALSIDYNDTAVCNDEALYATSAPFTAALLTDISSGTPEGIQAAAMALLMDLEAAGGVRFQASSLQAAVQLEFEEHGRRGAYYDTTSMRLEQIVVP